MYISLTLRDVPMRAILVAERFNVERRPSLDESLSADAERRIDVSIRLGCFRSGVGRRRLESLGLSWDASCNLLTPSPVTGEWSTADVIRVAEALWQRDYDRWLLIGRRVARTFGVSCLDFMDECHHAATDRSLVVVPHPSGQNRWWNHRELSHA